jgi:hypothetical protein
MVGKIAAGEIDKTATTEDGKNAAAVAAPCSPPPPRLTPVHNIKLTETRRDYALSLGASGRGTVTGTKPTARCGRIGNG